MMMLKRGVYTSDFNKCVFPQCVFIWKLWSELRWSQIENAQNMHNQGIKASSSVNSERLNGCFGVSPSSVQHCSDQGVTFQAKSLVSQWLYSRSKLRPVSPPLKNNRWEREHVVPPKCSSDAAACFWPKCLQCSPRQRPLSYQLLVCLLVTRTCSASNTMWLCFFHLPQRTIRNWVQNSIKNTKKWLKAQLTNYIVVLPVCVDTTNGASQSLNVLLFI